MTVQAGSSENNLKNVEVENILTVLLFLNSRYNLNLTIPNTLLSIFMKNEQNKYP